MDVVLVDKEDNILGYKEKYEAHHIPVPLHRAISVVIYDINKKKMLLQKRAHGKPTWPLFWSNTTCTHPLPEESYKSAAIRRLQEEMGIITPLREAFSFIYKAKYDEVWGEHELDVVFTGVYGGKVVLNKEEGDDFKWMNVLEIKKDMKDSPEKYTPWFKIIFKKLHE